MPRPTRAPKPAADPFVGPVVVSPNQLPLVAPRTACACGCGRDWPTPRNRGGGRPRRFWDATCRQRGSRAHRADLFARKAERDRAAKVAREVAAWEELCDAARHELDYRAALLAVLSVVGRPLTLDEAGTVREVLDEVLREGGTPPARRWGRAPWLGIQRPKGAPEPTLLDAFALDTDPEDG